MKLSVGMVWYERCGMIETTHSEQGDEEKEEM